MVLQPKPSEYPKIRKALRFYEIASVITGVMLLLLCAVMVMRYAFQVELFLFTPHAAAEFLPTIPAGQEAEFARPGFDLFKAILIAHGWFYVVYLVSDFMLWSPMRWHFGRFLLIALGGVVPFLSFVLEKRVAREVRAFLTEHDGGGGSARAPLDPPAADAAQTTEGRA